MAYFFFICQEIAFFLDGTKSNALYVIVASNCHKFDAIRWYLQLLQDSFRIARGTFFVMSQDCLLSIQSKLSLVVIGSKYRLIWITEKTM